MGAVVAVTGVACAEVAPESPLSAAATEEGSVEAGASDRVSGRSADSADAPALAPTAPSEPEEVSFAQLAMEADGIRDGALTYATTEESLAVQWDRYALSAPVPSVAWVDQIVLLFGSTAVCTAQTQSVAQVGTEVLVRLRLPTQPCQQGGDTTQVLALAREDLPPGPFTVSVTS